MFLLPRGSPILYLCENWTPLEPLSVKTLVVQLSLFGQQIEVEMTCYCIVFSGVVTKLDCWPIVVFWVPAKRFLICSIRKIPLASLYSQYLRNSLFPLFVLFSEAAAPGASKCRSGWYSPHNISILLNPNTTLCWCVSEEFLPLAR